MSEISRDVIFSEKKAPAGMPTHRTGVDNVKNQLKLIKNPPKILTEKQQEIINKEIQDRKQRQPRKPRKKNTSTKKGTYYSRRFNLKPDFDKNLIKVLFFLFSFFFLAFFLLVGSSIVFILVLLE